MDGISPNYIYAFILTISTLALLHICFRVMAIDLPQNFVSAQYLENNGQILTKLYYIYLY